MSVYRELENKRILITGGTQGIGEAIAYSFSEEGSKVAINGRKLDDKVKKVLEKTNAVAAMGDIGNAESALNIVEEAVSKLGGLDVLICNAAGMSMQPFLDQDPSDWWNQIHINLTGHIACIQKALPVMINGGGGTIIIVSSFFGTIGWKNASGYGASKSGLLTLGQYLAREYKKHNINVCIIIPGVIDTPQLNVDAKDLGISFEEVKEMYAQDIAMGRLGKASEIADLAIYMSTKTGGSALSGRHIQVSGGEYRTTPYYL